MSPLPGRSKPAIIRSNVVLPHPEEPRIEKNSFCLISSSTLLTATTSPNCLDTPVSATAGWLASEARVTVGDNSATSGMRHLVQLRTPERQHSDLCPPPLHLLAVDLGVEDLLPVGGRLGETLA